MGENEETKNEEAAPAPEGEPSLNRVDKILEKVKGAISSSGTEVLERAVKVLSEEAIDERVKLVLKGLSKHNELRASLKKISKPDIENFGTDGKPILSFTKERYEQIKKTKESLEKITKAFDAAFGTNDFSKLSELCK